ncbi:GNAT family N-acetyltransferase [Paenibacillus suaedae]|uniref:GNAT family N-acetyltransferase n=1 Tax=Paenibacillus suaedae TaxID=3077233 RepID=UPI0037446D69
MICKLWVAPAYRRYGISTKLKRKLEELAQTIDVNVIYTHTEAAHSHRTLSIRSTSKEDIHAWTANWSSLSHSLDGTMDD